MLESRSSIELVKDGGPIHDWDRHFVLNAEEARTVLLAEPLLRRFLSVGIGDGLLYRVEGTADCYVSALKLEGEIHGSPREWFFVEVSPPFSSQFELGLGKCEAVCALEAQTATAPTKGRGDGREGKSQIA